MTEIENKKHILKIGNGFRLGNGKFAQKEAQRRRREIKVLECLESTTKQEREFENVNLEKCELY